MPDLQASRIQQLHAAVEGLERLKANRAQKVDSIRDLQDAVESLVADIKQKRTQIRQMVTQFKPDLDNL
jgi:hypothetical protein